MRKTGITGCVLLVHRKMVIQTEPGARDGRKRLFVRATNGRDQQSCPLNKAPCEREGLYVFRMRKRKSRMKKNGQERCAWIRALNQAKRSERERDKESERACGMCKKYAEKGKATIEREGINEMRAKETDRRRLVSKFLSGWKEL